MKVVDSEIDLGLMCVEIDPRFSARLAYNVDSHLIDRLKQKRYSQAPVLDENGIAIGVATLQDLEECHTLDKAITLEVELCSSRGGAVQQ
jgi:predicted transcriptional regulator